MLPQKQRQAAEAAALPCCSAAAQPGLQAARPSSSRDVACSMACDGGAARLRHREPLLDVSEAQAPVTRGRFERRRKKRELRTKSQGAWSYCISMLASWVLVVRSQGVLVPVRATAYATDRPVAPNPP